MLLFQIKLEREKHTYPWPRLVTRPAWRYINSFSACSLFVLIGRVLPSADGDWTAFWWYDVDITWPSNEIDVLAYEFGHCKPSDPYCFGRLPSDAKADETEMLAVDSEGTAYKWSFISNASAASAAWRAFHDHQEVDHGVSVGSIPAWNPKVLNGSKPKNDQRAFMYRVQNGVKSVLLDDDNCDCLSTLSLGHGMCASGHNPTYSSVDSFGVDALYDPACHGPRSGIGLTLYVRRKLLK